MDGQSADAPLSAAEPGAKTYDAVVIGAGIAGLTCAYLLSREGLSVAVVERNGVGAGESGRTTAQFATSIDDRYLELERIHGAAASRLAAESQIDAIDLVEAIIASEGIACEARRVPGYLFLGPEHDSSFLDRECAAARRAGLPTRLVSSPVPSLSESPYLLFPNQLRLHPMEYLRGLERAIAARGGEFFFGHGAKTVRWENGEAEVDLSGGASARGRKVVVATNTPFVDRFKMHTKQAAYRTYVIAARVPRGTLPDAFYWDTSDPYRYVRLVGSAGERGDTVLIGGEDHKTGQDEESESRWSALESWARAKIPGISEITARWSGQVLEPVDALAYAGRNPGEPNEEFIITGDSGNGMTNATIGAKIVADLALGAENPYARLYDPARKTIRAAREFLKENLNVAGQYADWMKLGSSREIAGLAPGEGRVVRSDGKWIAVSRDENGTFRACSAICPHLGAMLRWNSAERTWDCPAHGSRFSAEGRILNGPAEKGVPRRPCPFMESGAPLA